MVRVGGAWTTHDGARLKVGARRGPRPAVTRFEVPTGDGPLWLVEVQPEGASPHARGGMGQRRGDPVAGLGGEPGTPVAGHRRPDAVRGAPVGVAAPGPWPSTCSTASTPAAPTPTWRSPGRSSGRAWRSADRRFATDLVYGTTRMRRACDHLVDRFLARPVEGRVRNALRLGAYQLAFAGVPAHAAVSETVAAAPRPARGLVNAVLRRVAEAPVDWPDDATRLSVPDWVLDELTASLGRERALAALAAMNEPATVTEREDGYVQDPASQAVAGAVGARPGERVLDARAAPGQGDGAGRRRGPGRGRRRPPDPGRARSGERRAAGPGGEASPSWSPTAPPRRGGWRVSTGARRLPAPASAPCGAGPTCGGGSSRPGAPGRRCSGGC